MHFSIQFNIILYVIYLLFVSMKHFYFYFIFDTLFFWCSYQRCTVLKNEGSLNNSAFLWKSPAQTMNCIFNVCAKHLKVLVFFFFCLFLIWIAVVFQNRCAHKYIFFKSNLHPSLRMLSMIIDRKKKKKKRKIILNRNQLSRRSQNVHLFVFRLSLRVTCRTKRISFISSSNCIKPRRE